MASEIVGALQGLKAAKEIVQAMLGMKISTDVNLKVAEVARLLGDAEERCAETQRRIGELEKALLEYEKWNEEKQRYELQAVGAGNLVYTVKEAERHDEPVHHLCPDCYEEQRKSILQVHHGNSINPPRGVWLMCSHCELAVRI